MGNANEISTDCAETSVTDGIAYIESASPLTRLHYFDGKFLKADALSQEQAYHRTRVRLSNQAGGWGVVNGLGISLSGSQLDVDGGLAITPAGNFVMNVGGVKVDLNELLKVAEPGPVDGNDDFQPCVQGQPKGTTASGLQFYEITVGPIDTLCGNEPVYGKLCESACVSNSQHPYWREGMVLRLRPINLKLPGSVAIPLTTTHLRNRMASAYFAIEPGATASQLSKAGLASNIWCGTTSLYGRDEVVIGLLSQDGTALKIDAWSGRRERMDTQARGYWQGRMAMRPFNVFLAQILQFQCQLSGLFDGGLTFEPIDQCDDLRAALAKAKKEIELLHKKYAASSEKLVERFTGRPTKADAEWAVKQAKGSADDLYDISQSLDKIDTGTGAMPTKRLLLNNGFQQLPPAGFLPVDISQTPLTEQIGRWFGEGVRLHYHAVRADEIGHLVEQAQHMQRISLTQGLDNPQKLEDVEIFLPDGQITSASTQTSSTWWQVDEDKLTAIAIGMVFIDAITSKLKEADASPEKAHEIAVMLKALRGASEAGIRMLQDDQASESRFNRLSTDIDLGPTLRGLARTDARADGSFGLTLVAGVDDAYQLAQATEFIRAKKDSSELAPQVLGSQTLNNDGTASGTVTSTGTISGDIGSTSDMPVLSYLAADIDTDPFSLDEGQMAAVRIETHVKVNSSLHEHVSAVTAQGDGGLTIVSKRQVAGGLTELLVDVSVSGQLVMSMISSKGPQTITADFDEQVSFKLSRQSGSLGGRLAVQPSSANGADQSSDMPCLIQWRTNPRQASLKFQLAWLPTDTPDATLRGLPGIPAPNALLRANANKLIDRITNFSQDAAFGMRAQQRLFGDGPVATTDSIEATQDWLMFRRARTLLCDPDCQGKPTSTDEAVQVWHIKVGGAEALKKLMDALSGHNAKALSGAKFDPVGVLHYPDESANAIESTLDVRTMWKRLDELGNTVVAGLTWERQPATGQGWQNHSRVFNMLQQVSDLMTPPADVGRGVIKAVKRAPAPLEDSTLDGGMLIVSMDKDVATMAHRVIMLPASISVGIVPSFDKNPDQGWTDVLSLLKETGNNKMVVEDLIVHFAGGQLDAASLQALNDKRNSMADKLAQANNGAQVVARYARGIESKTFGKEVDPPTQHQAVMDALNAVVLPGGADHYDVSATDLGSGAEVASLIFFDIGQVNGPA